MDRWMERRKSGGVRHTQHVREDSFVWVPRFVGGWNGAKAVDPISVVSQSASRLQTGGRSSDTGQHGTRGPPLNPLANVFDNAWCGEKSASSQSHALRLSARLP
eukprot:GHVU01011612.1.p2 GENE.GHVU01011612.1~~GHVU01011612.1.p2  ORF type:complete len:104 (+),score=3.24 GHVU01011612.1:528-839(+)